MDFQEDFYRAPYQNKRSETMAMASVILGIAALLTSGCIYMALICGALGIILALLSRGGEYTMSSQGRVGLILSAAGLILTLVIYTAAIVFVIRYYGGIDGFLQEYQNLYNSGSFESLYRGLGQGTI